MIAGGSEAAITPMGIGGFGALRALSTRNDEPAKASRPFDQDRDGFIVGEGAGVLILEEYERAKARGAKIYAELVGYGMSADAYHITAPSEDGDGAFRVMREAIESAGIAPDDVDYINAHGTSTPQGDGSRRSAIKRCFGDHAQRGRGVVDQVDDRPPARRRRRPRGRHHRARRAPSDRAADDQPGSPRRTSATSTTCRTSSRPLPITYALSNSFGFGGTNAALLFKRYEARLKSGHLVIGSRSLVIDC